MEIVEGLKRPLQGSTLQHQQINLVKETVVRQSHLFILI
jgi:hypothetical protein